MDRLTTLFTGLGLRDVATFLASGNVVFSSDADDTVRLRDMIQDGLHDQLGYEVATFLRSPTELVAITQRQPPDTLGRQPADASHYVILLDAPVSKALRAGLAPLQSAMDQFEFAKTEVHWHIQGKLTDSPLFGPGLDRAFGRVPTTTRNMNTLRRIVAKVCPPTDA
jgi:uncharacterized protein (DUF1697 family)